MAGEIKYTPTPMTDTQVVAALKADTPLNRARAKFSHWWATIEQSGMQRRPPGPVEVRRMEFQAAAEILSAGAGNLLEDNASLQSEIAALRAENERLREALTEAADKLEGLSHIHDGNPSDALAGIEPVDYARHMLGEARQMEREPHREARAVLQGGKDNG